MKQINKQDLIQEFHRLADELGKTPSLHDMQKHGKYSSSPYKTQFGSWNKAVQAIGYEINREGVNNPDVKPGPKPTSKQDLINELHRLTDELGKTPTKTEVNEHGKYSQRPYQQQFGSWNNALQEADLQVNKPTNVTPEDVIKDYQRVAEKLGKTPAQYEYDQHGKYSMRVTQTVFNGMKDLQQAAGLKPLRNGRVTKQCEICNNEFSVKHSLKDVRRCCSRSCDKKWRKEFYKGENNHNYERVEITCEQCDEPFEVIPSNQNTRRFCTETCMMEWRRTGFAGENHPRWNGGHSGYRGPNWPEQREKALKRDNHTCQNCHKKPDKLSVHHITAYKTFTDPLKANKLTNLITLCKSCHHKVEWGTIQLQTRLHNHSDTD